MMPLGTISIQICVYMLFKDAFLRGKTKKSDKCVPGKSTVRTDMKASITVHIVQRGIIILYHEFHRSYTQFLKIGRAHV